MTTLARYGLAAFGIDADTAINNEIASSIKSVYTDQEKGCRALNSILEELFQKSEAIAEGRSSGFRMFGSISSDKEQKDALTRKIFEILKSKGWGKGLVLTDNALLKSDQ